MPTPTPTEYTFIDEQQAHNARRMHISKGCAVSLVAYDPMRGVYTYDAYLTPTPNRVPCYCDSAYHPNGHPGL